MKDKAKLIYEKVRGFVIGPRGPKLTAEERRTSTAFPGAISTEMLMASHARSWVAYYEARTTRRPIFLWAYSALSVVTLILNFAIDPHWALILLQILVLVGLWFGEAQSRDIARQHVAYWRNSEAFWEDLIRLHTPDRYRFTQEFTELLHSNIDEGGH